MVKLSKKVDDKIVVIECDDNVKNVWERIGYTEVKKAKSKKQAQTRGDHLIVVVLFNKEETNDTLR